ncbi:histidine kinase dimerization/phospho-acceptor domain-containing protein [Roseateles chitinivorans]|uniref:histidine kinase dimerization/phospho-acceptor domain-containing protein n=1 Tax=Roseateles chitinivorans TaxID=2917965 RepID=UPI003D671405
MTVLSSLRSAGGLLRALRQRVDQLTAMLERQRRSQAQVEAFSANVAHELRTPLATLITGTELTIRDPTLGPEARDRLGANLEELRRMQGIVGDMLFLSRAYGGQRARRQRVDSLAALVAEVVDYHDAALDEAGLSSRIDGEAAGDFDAALLKRALSNLIANATRYATVGSLLRIGIEGSRSGLVRLWVANSGPVIPAKRLPRLFDRFYRADAAGSAFAMNGGMNGGGMNGVVNVAERGAGADGEHLGVGLSIVDAIARMHGGAPFARSDERETRIGLTLSGGVSGRAYTARRSQPSPAALPTPPTLPP